MKELNSISTGKQLKKFCLTVDVCFVWTTKMLIATETISERLQITLQTLDSKYLTGNVYPYCERQNKHTFYLL